jgi:hypothetical protein
MIKVMARSVCRRDALIAFMVATASSELEPLNNLFSSTIAEVAGGKIYLP